MTRGVFSSPADVSSPVSQRHVLASIGNTESTVRVTSSDESNQQIRWRKPPPQGVDRRQLGGFTTTLPTRRRRDSSIAIAGDEDASEHEQPSSFPHRGSAAPSATGRRSVSPGAGGGRFRETSIARTIPESGDEEDEDSDGENAQGAPFTTAVIKKDLQTGGLVCTDYMIEYSRLGRQGRIPLKRRLQGEMMMNMLIMVHDQMRRPVAALTARDFKSKFRSHAKTMLSTPRLTDFYSEATGVLKKYLLANQIIDSGRDEHDDGYRKVVSAAIAEIVADARKEFARRIQDIVSLSKDPLLVMKEWPSTEACLTDDHVVHWCLAIQFALDWEKEDKGTRSKFFIGLQNYLVKVGKRLGAKLDKEPNFSIRTYLWTKYVEPTRRSAAASKFGTAKDSKDWKQPLARLQTTKDDAQSQMFLLVAKTYLDIYQVAKANQKS